MLDTTKSRLEQESETISVQSVQTVSEALELLEADRVDCIVSDYAMPDTDGVSFLREVRSRNSQLPFILFTGQGSEEIAAAAISAGVTDYIKKGELGSVDRLSDHIEQFVENYRTEDVIARRLLAMETAREGIGIFDEDGYFIYVNSAYAEMYGYTPPELLGEHWTILCPEEDIKRVFKEILTEIPSAGRWLGEVEQITKDGSHLLTSQALSYADNGTIICVSFRISDKQEAEKLLAEERQRFDLLIEAITEYAIFSTDPDGEITTWNSGSERINGYEQGEILGQNISVLYTQQDIAEGEPDHHLELALEEGSLHEKGWRTRRDGHQYWADFTLTPVEEENGEYHGFVCVIRDMTDWLERERQLQGAVRQLDRFAGILSHDLRNPLSTAKVSLELIRDDPDDSLEHVDRADRALTRMDQLIESLLTLAREGKSVDEFLPLSLADCANTAWKSINAPDATLTIDSATGSVTGDSERIITLFENLFRNAVEYGGGAVTIRVGEFDDGFFVEDDGPGIPSEDREKVFEQGYSMGDNQTGFGLSIVQSIATAHNWDIAVTDSETSGARFEFRTDAINGGLESM